MTDQNLQEAKEIIAVGIAKIVGDYSDNALLINACFLAKERYENKREKAITGSFTFVAIDDNKKPTRILS